MREQLPSEVNSDTVENVMDVAGVYILALQMINIYLEPSRVIRKLER